MNRYVIRIFFSDSLNITREILDELLSPITIENLWLAIDSKGIIEGFGFIEFLSIEDKIKAIEILEKNEFIVIN